MTHRGRLHLRIVELGLIAMLGSVGAARAQPMPPPPPPPSPNAPAAPAAPVAIDSDGLNYIVLQDDNTSIVGGAGAVDRVRQLRHGKEPILWFREAGLDYLSRDPAVIGQIAAAWKSVQDLADQQSRLADRQSRLADEQSRLADQVVQTESRDDRKQLERQMHELSGKMSGLGRDMSALGRKMTEASGRAKLEVHAALRRAITSGAAKPMR